MTAPQWLVLDNLINGWPHRTNTPHAEADEALAWAKSQGLVDEHGRITDAGRGYFSAHEDEPLESTQTKEKARA